MINVSLLHCLCSTSRTGMLLASSHVTNAYSMRSLACLYDSSLENRMHGLRNRVWIYCCHLQCHRQFHLGWSQLQRIGNEHLRSQWISRISQRFTTLLYQEHPHDGTCRANFWRRWHTQLSYPDRYRRSSVYDILWALIMEFSFVLFLSTFSRKQPCHAGYCPWRTKSVPILLALRSACCLFHACRAPSCRRSLSRILLAQNLWIRAVH